MAVISRRPSPFGGLRTFGTNLTNLINANKDREATRAREEEEDKLRQATALKELVDSLGDPSVSEAEQAQQIGALDTISPENFKRIYGITQDEFKSQLPARSDIAPADVDEGINADPLLPPQSLQEGEVSPRIVRPGDDTPELRKRVAGADEAEATADLRRAQAENAALLGKIQQDDFNNATNEQIIRSRTGADKITFEDGTVPSVAQAKQIIHGDAEDPEVAALLEGVAVPTAIEQMTREFESAIPDSVAPTAEAKRALAKQTVFGIQMRDPGMLSEINVQTAQVQLKLLLQELEMKKLELAAAEQEGLTPATAFKPSDINIRRKQINATLGNAIGFMYGPNFRKFHGNKIRINENGDVENVTKARFFFGLGGQRGVPTSTDVPMSNAQIAMLFNPLEFVGSTALSDAGVDSTGPVAQLMTPEHVESSLAAVEAQLGFTIDGVQVLDKDSNTGVRVASRDEILARILKTRQDIIPAQQDLQGVAGSSEQLNIQQGIEFGNAARGMAESVGVDPGVEGSNPAATAFGAAVADVQRQISSDQQSLQSLIDEVKAELEQITANEE